MINVLQHELWIAFMTNKFLALIKNWTWSLIPFPKERKTIGFKWVFKVNENLDETINKYKAKLVERDFIRQLGLILMKHSTQ